MGRRRVHDIQVITMLILGSTESSDVETMTKLESPYRQAFHRRPSSQLHVYGTSTSFHCLRTSGDKRLWDS